MKKVLKYVTVGIVCCIAISYVVVKPGPDISKFLSQLYNDTYSCYCILVDFSKPSCEDRLFVYDVGAEPEQIYFGVVLHGCGGNSTPSKPEFSNKPGSKCSSLGEYTLEGLVTMNNGMEAIKLKGWSETNSNAESRGIYIHPSIMASLLPFNLPGMNFPLTKASEGCFAVSYHTYRFIKNCMQDESKHRKTKLIAYDGNISEVKGN